MDHALEVYPAYIDIPAPQLKQLTRPNSGINKYLAEVSYERLTHRMKLT